MAFAMFCDYFRYTCGIKCTSETAVSFVVTAARV